MKMKSNSRPSKGNKSSIKYWWVPHEVQSFEPDITCLETNVQPHSTSPTRSSIRSGNRISTAELVSAAGHLWGHIGQPIVSQANENLKYDEIFQKKNAVRYPDQQSGHKATSCADKEDLCYDLKPLSCFTKSAKSDFENLKTIKKMLLFASCNMNTSLVWRHIQINDCHSDAVTSGIGKIASLGVCNEPVTSYGSLIWKPFFRSRDLVKPCKSDSHHEIYSCRKKSSPNDLSSTRSSERNGRSEPEDSSSVENVENLNLIDNVQACPRSLHSTYSLQPVSNAEEAPAVLRSPSSGLQLDHGIELSTSTNCNAVQCRQSKESCSMIGESSAEVSDTKDHTVRENVKSLFHEHTVDGEFTQEQWFSIQDKLQHAIAKNRHFLAGALAGTLVSLSLHPVDTIKTIIQSNGINQKSFYFIVRTIISEKGVMGLYRGVASNIASSAPISAVYTFTYESVKDALLPRLPKEYHSFAHCAAGGCSSIATSFIFTPSERIKQQMQVGSQYQNCWNALVGSVEKGGVTSLYTGWCAVLCRNIPHSIIKFYAYESLKQLLFASAKSDAGLSTLQTLVCGGLAGSTAALFTTPFDVVKTRFQTQAPGSMGKYDGVLHALQDIAKNEGLQGLYRGLTPRLAIYFSQGAIFFAAYEFFKAVLSLNILQASAQVIIDKKKAEDSALSTMQKLPS